MRSLSNRYTKPSGYHDDKESYDYQHKNDGHKEDNSVGHLLVKILIVVVAFLVIVAILGPVLELFIESLPGFIAVCVIIGVGYWIYSLVKNKN